MRRMPNKGLMFFSKGVPDMKRIKGWQIDFKKSINLSELEPLSTGVSSDEEPYGF